MQITVNIRTGVQGVGCGGGGGGGQTTRQDNSTNAYLSHANWRARLKKSVHLIN